MIELQKLEYLSHEMDELLLDFAKKHDMHFLEVSAIILARLSHLSYELEESVHFAKLLDTAIETVLKEEIDESSENFSINSNSIH